MIFSEVSRAMHGEWIHTTKRRYYSVRVVQDLFGEWVLVKSWGSLVTGRGGYQRVVCDSLAMAESKALEIARRRRYRQYQPVVQRLLEEG